MLKNSFFPKVQAHNLLGQELALPNGLRADYNLLLLGFQQSHQSLTDSWVAPLEKFSAGRTDFSMYVMPVLPRMNGIARKMLEIAMVQAIQPQKARARTMLLYLDREKFLGQMAIPNFNNIVPVLIKSDGLIIWRGGGACDQSQFDQLTRLIK